MAKPTSTKLSKDKNAKQEEGNSEERTRQPAPSGSWTGILALQRSVGNRAVAQLLKSDMGELPSHPVQVHGEISKVTPNELPDDEGDTHAELLRKANAEQGSPLHPSLQKELEGRLDVDLSHVRVHTGPASEAAAENMDARAYTIGSDIHLGRPASQLSEAEQRELLAHEAVHTVQQGSRPVSLQGQMPVSCPGDPAEVEASQIASAVMSNSIAAPPSPALDIRNAMRTTSVAPSIQRDITGKAKVGYDSEFEINFTKNEGAVAGDTAREDGTIKFTPGRFAPESDSIRFVQTVRNFDTATGKLFDWTGTAQADLNKMRTARDRAKNIAPGFHVDQRPDLLSKRTKKADPAVLPYYDAMLPNPGNQIGKRKGKVIVPAILDDHPGANIPIKWNFVTSAKAADTGTWYGTVLWGFETFLDKKGILKIRGEYRNFREYRGETTDEALRIFNEFYQNPGATTAPKK